MDNPAVELLFGSDIGILSIITVGATLFIVVALLVMFFVRSGKQR